MGEGEDGGIVCVGDAIGGSSGGNLRLLGVLGVKRIGKEDNGLHKLDVFSGGAERLSGVNRLEVLIVGVIVALRRRPVRTRSLGRS